MPSHCSPCTFLSWPVNELLEITAWFHLDQRQGSWGHDALDMHRSRTQPIHSQTKIANFSKILNSRLSLFPWILQRWERLVILIEIVHRYNHTSLEVVKWKSRMSQIPDSVSWIACNTSLDLSSQSVIKRRSHVRDNNAWPGAENAIQVRSNPEKNGVQLEGKMEFSENYVIFVLHRRFYNNCRLQNLRCVLTYLQNSKLFLLPRLCKTSGCWESATNIFIVLLKLWRNTYRTTLNPSPFCKELAQTICYAFLNLDSFVGVKRTCEHATKNTFGL